MYHCISAQIREIEDGDEQKWPEHIMKPRQRNLVSYPSKLISLFGEKFKKYSLSRKNEYIQPKVLQQLDKIPDFQITLDFLPFLASFFLYWYSSYSNRLGYYCCCRKNEN